MLNGLFKAGLSKTRQAFNNVVELLRVKGKVDNNFINKLEKNLYLADFGVVATTEIVESIRTSFVNREINCDIEEFVRKKLVDLLLTQTDEPYRGKPIVNIVVGVNGSGKTTSIAKLAKRNIDDGKNVIVAACDTFRAAATEQLTIWSQRLGCHIVKNQQGADPASIAHDACEMAKAKGCDLLIVDTAGRLHTQTHLMRELEKINRVISKQIDGAPHESFMVLDATSGQNAVMQAEQFKKIAHCTGIIMSKLDGTAKGGIIFDIKRRLNLSVKYIGFGEDLDDFSDFDPHSYVDGLFTTYT